ncbi:MAG: glycosyltransferase [Duncaniella sp.]|nr:glycosyltransferase [Duncaniella sp.]
MNSHIYTLIHLSAATEITFEPLALHRLEGIISTPGVSMVYSDYFVDGERMTLIDCQDGSVRDDFNFGPVVAVKTALLPDDFSMPRNNIEWYRLRLALSRMGNIIRIPEPLYSVKQTGQVAESQFDYVDPRNRSYQIEMEKICTAHLRDTGALLTAEPAVVDLSTDCFPVEASVVIPVRNRVTTIKDAVNSALGQAAGFDFNVIVVDNGSTDGTLEALLSIDDKRLHVISVPKGYNMPGIGGCWNRAIFSDFCGKFAVQLDSDDVYSSPSTLQRIVDKFYEEKCAMVVGSYTLTDFDLNIIPPGLIDHREWTPDNGRNNLLRINGIGAPRAFFTPVARSITFPDASYGEDYAMALAVSRTYRIGRIFDSLYFCRRWHDNTDASLDSAAMNRNNFFKDTLRTRELHARIALNSSRK